MHIQKSHVGFHHFFHRVDKEMAEVSFFQLCRTVGTNLMSLSVVYFLWHNLSYEIWQICLFFAIWEFFFILVIPFVGAFVQKIGLKHSLVSRCLVEIVFWLAFPLVMVPEHGFWINILYLSPFFLLRAFFSSASNMAYAIFLTHHMQREAKGKMLAIIQIGVMLGSIMAPIIGAFATYYFGISASIYIAVLFFFLGGVFLFCTPDEKIKVQYNPQKIVHGALFKESSKKLWIAEFGWVFYDCIIWFIWPLFLLLLLGDLLSMGMLIGASSAIAMTTAFFIGKKLDNPNTKPFKVLYNGSWRSMIINALRVVWPSPIFMTLVDALHRINFQSVIVPHDYQLFKWFHDRNTYERVNMHLFIWDALYTLSAFLFALLFYVFNHNSHSVFILIFIGGALSYGAINAIVRLK